MTQWGGQRGTEQVAVIFVFLTLACVVFSLRLFTRVVLIRNHGLEDIVITAAFVFSVAYAALVLVEVQHGQGLSDELLSASDLLFLKKTLWKSIPCYLTGLTLTKLSILLQYRRLFKERGVSRCIVAMLVFVFAYGTWSIIGSLFLCTPVQAFWDQSISGRCMNLTAKWFSDAAVNICQDLVLLILPMPYLKSLNLPKRQKAGLMAVFALGGFVCMVSMARLRPLYVIATSNNISKSNGPAAWLSSLEVNIGIICASLPCLRAIILRTCSRRPSNPVQENPAKDMPPHRWWPMSKTNSRDVELGDEDQSCSAGQNSIRKVVTIFTDTRSRDEGRKLSGWSLSSFGGGIWDGGSAKAWIKSGAVTT